MKVETEACRSELFMLSLWKHECTRVIADRFIDHADKTWFDDCMLRVLRQQVGVELVDQMPDEAYLVDFLRDAAELTGDEPEDFVVVEPKVYEIVSCRPSS